MAEKLYVLTYFWWSTLTSQSEKEHSLVKKKLDHTFTLSFLTFKHYSRWTDECFIRIQSIDAIEIKLTSLIFLLKFVNKLYDFKRNHSNCKTMTDWKNWFSLQREPGRGSKKHTQELVGTVGP